MAKVTEPEVSLSKLSPKSKWILGTYCVIAVLLTWQAILPFLAERRYRDGYNFDSEQRYKYAIEEYQKAIGYAPWEAQYQLDLARVYTDFATQQTQLQDKLYYLNKAEEMSLRMIELDNKSPWYRNRLGSIYMTLAGLVPARNQEYLQKAEANIRAAADIDNKNPLFQLNLAYFLHQMGRVDEAFEYYQKAIVFDERIPEAHYNLADLYIRKGNYDAALNEYILTAKSNQDFGRINVAIADLCLMLYSRTQNREYLQKAVPYMENELKKNSADPKLLKNLGSIYTQDQKWGDAARVYDQYMIFHPEDTASVLGLYAQAVANSGQKERIIVKLQRDLEINPLDSLAAQKLKSFR